MNPTLNNDQAIRIQCLQMCGGCVAEAKNAYYWVMNDAASAVKSQASQQDRQKALQQQVASSQLMNATNSYIGGGFPD